MADPSEQGRKPCPPAFGQLIVGPNDVYIRAADVDPSDLGDDESDEGPFEWDAGRIPGRKDDRGDDDVEIVLRETGAVEVAYRSAGAGC